MSTWRTTRACKGVNSLVVRENVLISLSSIKKSSNYIVLASLESLPRLVHAPIVWKCLPHAIDVIILLTRNFEFRKFLGRQVWFKILFVCLFVCFFFYLLSINNTKSLIVVFHFKDVSQNIPVSITSFAGPLGSGWNPRTVAVFLQTCTEKSQGKSISLVFSLSRWCMGKNFRRNPVNSPPLSYQ